MAIHNDDDNADNDDSGGNGKLGDDSGDDSFVMTMALLKVGDDNDDKLGDDSGGNGNVDAQEAEVIAKCGVCMPAVQQWLCHGGCGRVACGVDIPISQELRAAIGTVKDWCCGSCPMNKQYLKGWLGRHAESEHGPRCGRCACKY